MGELDGHVAVVTGAGRGIGRAIALELATEGARIVVSSRTGADLDTVVNEARARGSDGRAVVCDAMLAAQAKRPVAVAVDDFGRIDVLVNNVGGSTGGNLDPFDGDDASFQAELTLNLLSAYWTTREALPHMRKQRYGRIVNIGSGASKRAAANPAYTAAKHGLVGLTKALPAASVSVTMFDRFAFTRNALPTRAPDASNLCACTLAGPGPISSQMTRKSPRAVDPTRRPVSGLARRPTASSTASSSRRSWGRWQCSSRRRGVPVSPGRPSASTAGIACSHQLGARPSGLSTVWWERSPIRSLSTSRCSNHHRPSMRRKRSW